MSGSIVFVVSYVLLGIFAVAFIMRTLKIWRMPVHLRWELAPVPHEKGKGHYGGSYLEEPEWWTKPREKDFISEVTYMAKEIVFLKALWEHNRKMWWFSYPFHLGMYLLTLVLGLAALGGIAAVAGIPGPGVGLLRTVAPLLAGAGYALGAIGAVGLIISRIVDPNLRAINTPLSFLNLLLLAGVFVSGEWALFTLEAYSLEVVGFVEALLTADLSAAVPGALAVHVILAGIFLAYLPFTQMMHFVAKYFTYHEVRWNDDPLEAGSKMEKEIQELLKQPVTWAAPHLRADGRKNWVDIATDTGAKEEAR